MTIFKGGKRNLAVHGAPKTATFKGQLEYLDKIMGKYESLIATEEALKETTQAIEESNHLSKQRALYEKAQIAKKSQIEQLEDQIKYKRHRESTLQQ